MNFPLKIMKKINQNVKTGKVTGCYFNHKHSMKIEIRTDFHSKKYLNTTLK